MPLLKSTKVKIMALPMQGKTSLKREKRGIRIILYPSVRKVSSYVSSTMKAVLTGCLRKVA